MGITYSATKLKVLLRTAVQRMSMSINKKNNSIKVDSKVISQLLANKKDESARIKVEGVIHQKNLVLVMEIAQLMCELLLARIGLITAAKLKIPDDLEEAAATIIYCSKRLEIKELSEISHQLGSKFGEAWANSHLQNGSGKVNQRVITKLAIAAPEFDSVLGLMQEIAATHEVEWTPDLGALESAISDHNPERLGAIAKIPEVQPMGDENEQKLAEAVNAMDVPGAKTSQQPVQSVAMAATEEEFKQPVPGLYPGTLNLIVHKAKELVLPNDHTDTFVRISVFGTNQSWKSAIGSVGGPNPSWEQPFQQHWPLAVKQPETKLKVEVIMISRGKETSVGVAVLVVDDVRRSTGHLWYSLYTEEGKSSGFLMLSSQFIPLNATISPSAATQQQLQQLQQSNQPQTLGGMLHQQQGFLPQAQAYAANGHPPQIVGVGIGNVPIVAATAVVGGGQQVGMYPQPAYGNPQYSHPHPQFIPASSSSSSSSSSIPVPSSSPSLASPPSYDSSSLPYSIPAEGVPTKGEPHTGGINGSPGRSRRTKAAEASGAEADDLDLDLPSVPSHKAGSGIRAKKRGSGSGGAGLDGDAVDPDSEDLEARFAALNKKNH